MLTILRWLLTVYGLAILAAGPTMAQPTVRVGVLNFGTVHWELDVIRSHGLDAKAGVKLEVIKLGSKRATAVALQGGGADVIVTDWIWVSRQRAQGRDYTFVPHALTAGGLIARPDSGIASVADLAGKRIGVAGGPVDKSWLVMRAYAHQQGLDLAARVEPVFGAPPLLNELIGRGDLPAVLNFWHYNARLKAAGMTEVITVRDMLPALGAEGAVPLIGWVFDRAWATANRDALHRFLDASFAAKHLMLRSDAEWTRLAPLLKAKDAATAAALRDAYRAGIPRHFDTRDQLGAAHLFAVLAREGGAKLVGASNTLTPGTFWTEYEVPRWPE